MLDVDCKIGDMVRIIECAPISKRKTWTLVERNGQIVGGVEAAAVEIVETHPAPPAPAPHESASA